MSFSLCRMIWVDELIKQSVDKTFWGFDPVFSPASVLESEILEELQASKVGLIDEAMYLVNHEIVEQVFQKELNGLAGMTLLAMGFVDENAHADSLVDGVIVEKVHAADRTSFWRDMDHQSHLLVGDQVAVAEKELLNLEPRYGCVGFADTPYPSVVLPGVD